MIFKRETARRENLEMLQDFIKGLAGKKKTPKDLLKLVVYTDGIKASEAAEILGVKRHAVDLFLKYLLQKGLLDVESLKHPNPTIKPTLSVIMKMKKEYDVKKKRLTDDKSQINIDDLDIDSIAEEVSAASDETTFDADIERQLAELDLNPEPEPPKPEPVVEVLPEPDKPDPELLPSTTYLVLEEDTEKSERLFKSRMDEGVNGLYITRSNPSNVKRRIDSSRCNFVWLTSVQTSEAIETIEGVQDLSIHVGNFLDNNKNCVMLLDGIEYLISNNNFQLVLKLIQQLRDKVSTTDAILIIPLNPGTVSDMQLARLDVESEVIE